LSIDNARIIVVTGKGGVGKTTLAATLAVRQANKGKRVLIAEFGGATRIPPLFGVEGSGYQPTRLTERVFALSLTPQDSIEDFVVLRLKLRSLYRLIFDNRMMRPFLAAVPGLHDLVQLGKLYYEESLVEENGAPTWDQIILDGPSTGHGITMLHAPRSMMDLTRVGPFFENAELVHDLFSNPTRCQLVVASLPQKLVVNEALELAQQLGSYRKQLALCILNQVEPSPLRELSWWESARPHLVHDDLAEPVAFMDQDVYRAQQAKDANARLSDTLQVDVVALPRLDQTDLGPPQLLDLADVMDASL
jgi:arsenite-transporting ATPase